MASKKDQRIRADLDLFLLALISKGIDTPYRMQSLAGISQGASLQSLKRLTEQNLIAASKEGPRRRKQFSLTRSGTSCLRQNNGFLTLEPEPAGDFESILRTALLLAYMKGDHKAAVTFLKAAGSQRRSRARDMGDNSEGAPEMVQRYARFRQTMASAVAGVEAEVFEQAASNLKPRSKRRA
jgi:hypothetical protein